MAPKTPASLSHQPSKEKPQIEPPSSDEEDDDYLEDEEEQQEEDDDETEEGSSSEDEGTDLQKGANGNKTLISNAKSDGSDSDSDSDPDSDGSPSDYKLQPILKKPSAAPAKRAAIEEADVTHSTLKRCKKSKTEDKKSSSSSGGSNTRLWSNDDEIALLNAMIEFRNTKRVDPSSDMSAFHGFIKGKLQAGFSKGQVKTKMSGLKKRFANALKKCENGSDPVFSKPHDDHVFELSKKIWGGDSEGGKKIEKTKKDNMNEKKALLYEKMREVVAKEENGGVKELDFWSKYTSIRESLTNMAIKFPSLAMSEPGMNSVKERLSLIGKADAKQLNDKWKKLILEETELNYKMLTLMNEQIKMAFNQ